MSEERLQKVLSRAGVASRRKSEELISAGRVTVNGEMAKLGQKVGPDDAVKVDGRLVREALALRYFLLNKPPGYITTRSDPEERPTVFDLIAPRHRGNLVPVGRLDYNSEGLLILTNDGELAQTVSHPRYGCRKTYLAKVKGQPSQDSLDRLRRGMVLDGHRTSPARVEASGRRGKRLAKENTWWEVEIAEGRTRQIREMFFRIGHPVQRLRRVAVGPVEDSRLVVGSYRELTESEIAALQAYRGKS